MLHAVPELPQDHLGQVLRALGYKVHSAPLRANETDYLLDLVDEYLGGAVEEEVGLIEEEHQLRLGQVAYLGEHLEELGQHPQEEGRVEARGLEQAIGGQDVDEAPAVAAGLEKVWELQRWLAKEAVAALLRGRDIGDLRPRPQTWAWPLISDPRTA